MAKDMVGGLVVTHGDLAKELVGAARKIVGKLGNLEAVSIGWDDDVASARRAIEVAIKNVDEGGGILILTDMFGGTPTNISLSWLSCARFSATSKPPAHKPPVKAQLKSTYSQPIRKTWFDSL